jgi:hypothetical protein
VGGGRSRARRGGGGEFVGAWGGRKGKEAVRSFRSRVGSISFQREGFPLVPGGTHTRFSGLASFFFFVVGKMVGANIDSTRKKTKGR